MGTIWRVLTRKKTIDPNDERTQLARVLNTFDLTSLGVGSTLGVGVYVIAGHVAREVAGPSVVLSFLIAAIASVFAGLCYAEFGARTPRAGSAYIYSYVCVGEFIAFIIGWNLILEYVIGSASVARGMSLYLDTLLNDTLKDAFKEIAPITTSFMSDYFDFFSFGIAVILSVGLAFGMKESSLVNNIFTVLNIMVVLFVVIAGSFKANPENWNRPGNETDPAIGAGGFFPFGFEGMIKGAATCFYGFVGFDCIATTGEEVKNPKRAIPIAIISSLAIIFLAYFSTSTVVTMMVPYNLQDPNAPIPHAFAEVGWTVAKWIVAIGAIFGLCASLFGAMFPLPRVIYAMATDGLVFKFLGRVSARFSTPVIGTLLAGLLTGLMSALFDLQQLVNMMSIGTLMAYSIVAACVLLLRYEAAEDVGYIRIETNSDSDSESYEDYPEMEGRDRELDPDANKNNVNYNQSLSFSRVLKQMCNFNRVSRPTKISENLASVFVTIYCLLALLMGLCVTFWLDQIKLGRIYAIVLTSVVGFLMIVVLMTLSLQPTSGRNLTFKVPLVPLIPALSILVNFYLMLQLDPNTWIRFGVWMVVGLPIYVYCVCKRTCAENKNITKSFDEHANGKAVVLDGYSNEESSENSGASLQKASDKTKTSDYGSMEMEAEAKDIESAPVIENETQKYEDRSKKSISSVDVVLAELDDVLRTEETAMSGVDVRKLSVDTISTASNVPVEESVVALVHREDIVSNPASPITDRPLPVPFNSIVDDEAPKEELVSRSSTKGDNNHDSSRDVDYDTPKILSNKEEINDEGEKVPDEIALESNGDEPRHVENDMVSNDRNSFKDEATQTPVTPLEGNGDEPELFENEMVSDTSSESSFTNMSAPNTMPPLESNGDEPQHVEYEMVSDMSRKNSFNNIPTPIPTPPLETNEVEPENVENEVVSDKSTENDFKNLSAPIPAPPPLEDYEKYKTVKIPRVSEKREHLHKSPGLFTKHPPPFTPPAPTVIPSRHHSRQSSMSELADDNVTFGSKEHERIKEKLSLFLQSNLGVEPPKKLTKPEVHETNDDDLLMPTSPLMKQVIAEIPKAAEKPPEDKRESESDSGVDTSPIKPSDIRNRLNEILRQSVRVPKETKRKIPRFEVADAVEPGDHKRNMQDTLNLIKLRKLESFGDKDKNANVVPDMDEKSRHKVNMGDAFASIRLRKTESLKKD